MPAPNSDGFVKSPSVRLGGLRFTFVVAAYLVSTPLSSVPLGAGLRALHLMEGHGDLFPTLPSQF